MTNCTQESFEYLRVNRRVAEASFDGGEFRWRRDSDSFTASCDFQSQRSNLMDAAEEMRLTEHQRLVFLGHHCTFRSESGKV